MRVVFDTNVLISSTLRDGSVAQKLLFELIHSDVPIFSSTEILVEYQKVLKRDFEYTDEETIDIIKKILSYVAIVKPSKKIDVIKEDPEDNKIIECAVASAAEYIVTYDHHLLKIKNYDNIKIITPEEAIKMF